MNTTSCPTLKRSLSLKLAVLLSLLAALLLYSHRTVNGLIREGRQEVALIDATGRQRMLVQQFVRQTNLALVGLSVADWPTLLEQRKLSAATSAEFDQNLHALLQGGTILPDHSMTSTPSVHSEVRTGLEEIAGLWAEVKRASVKVLRSETSQLRDHPDLAQMQSAATRLVAKVDATIALMQLQETKRDAHLSRYQTGILVGGLGVFALIALFVHRSIIHPLAETIDKLDQSEEQHRHLYEAAPVCLWQAELSAGRLFKSNAAMNCLLGPSGPGDDRDNRTVYSLLPDAAAVAFKSALETDGEITNFETTTLPQGTTQERKSLIISARLYRDKGFAEGAVVDITERKRAEEALRRSEENSRLLFETTLQGVVFEDLEGRVISVNPAATEILGRTREELLSQGLASEDSEHATLREDGSPFPTTEHPALRALATGHEVRNVTMGIYNPREHDYRWVDMRAVPLFRAGTKTPHQVYTIFDDITERRRNECHIRRQTALLTGINRIFLETLPHLTDDEVTAIFLQVIRELTASPIAFAEETDTTGNAQRITLAGSLQAETDLSRADASALIQHGESLRLAIQDAGAGGTQILNRTWSDTLEHHTIKRFLGVPLVDNGKTIGFIELANKSTDYTEADKRAVEVIAPAFIEVLKRKRSEQAVLDLNEQLAGRALALEQANKELESFSYSVAHDLRAPLRGLDAFSRLLVDDCEKQLSENGKDYLRRILNASQRMGHLIDDMLHLAKVSRSELRRAPVNLSALAQTVANGFEMANPQRKIEFVIEPDLIAQGDARLLQIVLENLFGNACKFSASAPLTKIEFGRTIWRDQPVLFVRDNGVGFDMAYAHKLFGAFQRLHSEKDFPGTGIGLATVQRIINRHGGIVAAESRPGNGATFYFTLPEQAEPLG